MADIKEVTRENILLLAYEGPQLPTQRCPELQKQT
jgi:hypothetical protein